MDGDLRVQGGGDGDPVLLLLHGLGATGDVWAGGGPLLAQRWPGRWLAPDLPVVEPDLEDIVIALSLARRSPQEVLG